MLPRVLINKVLVQATQKETERYCKSTRDTSVLYSNHTGAQHMARAVQDVAELFILSECAVVTERCTEQFKTHSKMLRKQRCQ